MKPDTKLEKSKKLMAMNKPPMYLPLVNMIKANNNFSGNIRRTYESWGGNLKVNYKLTFMDHKMDITYIHYYDNYKVDECNVITDGILHHSAVTILFRDTKIGDMFYKDKNLLRDYLIAKGEF